MHFMYWCSLLEAKGPLFLCLILSNHAGPEQLQSLNQDLGVGVDLGKNQIIRKLYPHPSKYHML